jgi:serine/threonine-protein kinase
MAALADAGDRGGALRHAGVYAALLREELGVAPDPEVEAFAERLRASPPATHPAPPRTRAPAPAPPAPAPSAAPAGDEERYLRHLQRALGGRYAPERVADVSAMATVYAARHAGTARAVTLTVIKPAVAAALRVDVFLDEMLAARHLAHPHLVPLCDADVAGDPRDSAGDWVLYYAMPAVDGEPLRARLERERTMPVGEAVRIAVEVADALAHAHEHGVIHRDVKPRHIVLAHEPGGARAMLANLGVAGALLRASDQSATQSGLVLGSPAYMSPEQLAGRGTIDGRSDMYSLACVLYEMLAGAPPFTGPTVHAVAAGRWTAPPAALRTIREAVPSGVERAVARALERVPADRFRTAAEFRDALAVS